MKRFWPQYFKLGYHKASRQALEEAGEQTYNWSANIPDGIK